MPPPWKMMNGLASMRTEVENCSLEEHSTSDTSNAPLSKNFGAARLANGAVTNAGGNASNNNEVKVLSWPVSATEDDLKSVFSSAGEVIRAKVLAPRDGRDTTLCFVTFSKSEEMELAVTQLHNHEVDGVQIKVEVNRRGNGPQRKQDQVSHDSSKQLKVCFWPAALSEEDLKTLFSQAGEVVRTRILPARDGRDFTLAFVSFSTEESVQCAISKLNGHEIEGRRLKLQADDATSSSVSMQRQGEKEEPASTRASNGNQVKVLSCPSSASEDELKDIFGSAGTVERVKILPAREGRDITLAFITFSLDAEASIAAEKFNGFELMGKRLRVSVNEQNNSSQRVRSHPDNEDQGSKAREANAKPWGSGACASPAEVRTFSSFGRTSFEGAASDANDAMGRLNVDSDGILIGPHEMNFHSSLERGRAPVIYIPPPPPEEESEIFKDSCHKGINFQNYENIPVEVTGKNPPEGVNSFQEAALHSVCDLNIKRTGYDVPTPIQKRALPIILKGRDVMACAQTGSGKTAAYLLPIISNLLTNDVSDAEHGEIAFPRALIIAPTRELAVQIYLEARKFAYGSRLKNIVIYGGVSVSYQLGKLSEGSDILVATPGRLKDFIDRGRISLSQVLYLVLDEADRMLDMGFEPIISKIVGSSNLQAKGKRQTLMLSATFPERIQTLAANYLDDYIFITVGVVGSASTDINQNIIDIPSSEKRTKLEEILLESGENRILVFVETKRSADFLASFLSQRKFPTTSINGDRSQEERECALKDFRSGRAPVLIATAVAARGLDIADVKMVINFDLPSEIDEYVHRIGRTGRIGNKGCAIAFFDRSRDQNIARGLIKVLSASCQDVPEWLEEVALSAVGTNYGPGAGQFSSRDKRVAAQGRLRNGTTVQQAQQQSDGTSLKAKVQTSSSDVKANNASNGDNDDAMWC